MILIKVKRCMYAKNPHFNQLGSCLFIYLYIEWQSEREKQNNLKDSQGSNFACRRWNKKIVVSSKKWLVELNPRICLASSHAYIYIYIYIYSCMWEYVSISVYQIKSYLLLPSALFKLIVVYHLKQKVKQTYII